MFGMRIPPIPLIPWEDTPKPEPIVAYKALDGKLYETTKEVHKVNEKYLKRQKRTKAKTALTNTLITTSYTLDCNGDRRYNVEALVERWEEIRDALNRI